MEYRNSKAAIDLHIHSTASDGTFSPSGIIALAEKIKLGAISITDHDAIEGSKEAFSLDRPGPMEFLTGVEISVEPPPGFLCRGSFHILGYGIRLDDNALNRTLQELRKAREDRNPRILEKLSGLGFNISMPDIEAKVGGGQIGRPHIARRMVEKGFAGDVDEAFGKYLAKGKPAYVDKRRLACGEGIRMISEAGGISVLAHPFLLKPYDNHDIKELLPVLKSMGLKGLEAHYTEHPPGMADYYARMAKRHGLVITGGSDFHGTIKPAISMGTGKGDLFVPFECYETIDKLLKSR